MSLEVTAWNVLDAYSEEDSARELVTLMLDRRPDLAVFPEAYAEDNQRWLDNVQEDYEAAGYRVTHGLYEDDDRRADRHGLLVISREDLTDTDAGLVRLAGRNAIALTMYDEAADTAVHFVGLHLDDRSETTRLRQSDSLLHSLPEGKPTVLAGDFNAMHHNGVVPTMLRLAKPITEALPSVDPDPRITPPRLARFGSIASRLAGMAHGATLARIEAAGFTDADSRHQPTAPAKRPLFQLDHIMTNHQVDTLGHEVHPHNPLSDHRAISARLATRA